MVLNQHIKDRKSKIVDGIMILKNIRFIQKSETCFDSGGPCVALIGP